MAAVRSPEQDEWQLEIKNTKKKYFKPTRDNEEEEEKSKATEDKNP